MKATRQRVRRHSLATRAEVLARVRTGASVREAAEGAGVPVSTAGDIAARESGRIRTETAAALGDRLLALVDKIVEGGIAAAGLLSDPEYLRAHKPQEVAALAGTLLERAHNILKAADRDAEPEAGGGPLPGAAVDLGALSLDELQTLERILTPKAGAR